MKRALSFALVLALALSLAACSGGGNTAEREKMIEDLIADLPQDGTPITTPKTTATPDDDDEKAEREQYLASLAEKYGVYYDSEWSDEQKAMFEDYYTNLDAESSAAPEPTTAPPTTTTKPATSPTATSINALTDMKACNEALDRAWRAMYIGYKLNIKDWSNNPKDKVVTDDRGYGFFEATNSTGTRYGLFVGDELICGEWDTVDSSAQALISTVGTWKNGLLDGYVRTKNEKTGAISYYYEAGERARTVTMIGSDECTLLWKAVLDGFAGLNKIYSDYQQWSEAFQKQEKAKIDKIKDDIAHGYEPDDFKDSGGNNWHYD